MNDQAARTQLRALSERLARAVSDIRCFVTREDADRLEFLQDIVGERWDAVNQRWMPLDE